MLTCMATNHYEQLLLDKERDLLDEITRRQEDARNSRTSEVEDPIDQVTSAEAKAEGFQESTLAAQTLAQVRAALQRIQDGTYGSCLDCGRQIPPVRLEAVPWAPYCIEDQQKHDAAVEFD